MALYSPRSNIQAHMQSNTNAHVVVIGGGPGGSTAATLLARDGFRVTLLEKTAHPRFHIGESLLPANLSLLDKLGVRAAVEKIGMKKWGVEFNSPNHDYSSGVEFAEAWDKTMPYSFQVRRSEFDEILFRNAAAAGATALENTTVTLVHFDRDGVRVDVKDAFGNASTVNADFVVDASGRDTFLSSRLKLKEKNAKHNSVAVFGHFTNAERLPGKREGDISIFWFDHGWIWFIPLSDGTTSVGAVCWPHYLASREKSLKDFFMDTVSMNTRLADRLKHAKLVDDLVHAAGNYSYSSRRATGERYLLVGDAFAFVDPVFSSGVYLAMHNAFDAASTVATCLREPRAAHSAMAKYEKRVRQGPTEFSWFIYRVTNPIMRELFMAPRNLMRAKEAVLSVLAGHIFDHKAIRPSLWVFKSIYYIASALNLKQTLAAKARRKINIQDTPAAL